MEIAQLSEWITVDPETSCWHWQGHKDRDGYGVVYAAGRTRRAHRWVYEHLVGPIPPRHVLDHGCYCRECVNPQHVEPVTIEVNRARVREWRSLLTHCPRGHAYEGNNLIIERGRNGSVHRRCRACKNAWLVAYRTRKRAAS